MRGLSLHWNLCEGAFGFLDGFGACSLSITECTGLTTDAQLLPIAASCLSSCSNETGCTIPMIGHILTESDACPQGVPSALLMTLVDLPWAPLLAYSLAVFNLFINPGFNLAPDAAWADRFPIPEYLACWLQSFILLRAVYFVLKNVGDSRAGPLALGHGGCGFLLFNTIGLSGTVVAALAPIVATLIAISRGVLRENEAIKAEAGHSAERTTLSMARNVQVLPLLAVIVTVLLMTVGTLGLVFITIPALIFLCHVTISFS